MLIYSHIPFHATLVSVPPFVLSCFKPLWRMTQWPAQLAKEKLGLAFTSTHHQDFLLSPSIPQALNNHVEPSKDPLI